jgi:hypothetical protein
MSRVAFLLAVLLLGSCGSHGAGTGNGSRAAEPDVSTPDGPNLAPAEIAEYERKAMAGDNEAAATLAVHFGNRSDDAQMTKWLSVAAARGDCHSIGLLMENAYIRGQHSPDAARWRREADRFHCPYDIEQLKIMDISNKQIPVSNR